MTAVLAWILSRLSPAALAIIGLIVFYEGMPLGPLRSLPLIGPSLEVLTDGRVDRERKAARQGFVQEARAIAAEAKAAELERQLAAGRKALGLYADLLQDAQAKEQAAIDADEQRIADYEKKLAEAGRTCGLTQPDVDWLRQP